MQILFYYCSLLSHSIILRVPLQVFSLFCLSLRRECLLRKSWRTRGLGNFVVVPVVPVVPPASRCEQMRVDLLIPVLAGCSAILRILHFLGPDPSPVFHRTNAPIFGLAMPHLAPAYCVSPCRPCSRALQSLFLRFFQWRERARYGVLTAPPASKEHFCP